MIVSQTPRWCVWQIKHLNYLTTVHNCGIITVTAVQTDEIISFIQSPAVLLVLLQLHVSVSFF